MGEQKTIRIVIVDDHPIRREGFGSMIRHRPDMAVVARTRDGRRRSVVPAHRPRRDAHGPAHAGLGGVETFARSGAKFPQSRSCADDYDGRRDIYAPLEAGSAAYMLKEHVLRRDPERDSGRPRRTPADPAEVGTRLADAGRHGPERREQEVRSSCQGKEQQEIGKDLAITDPPSKGHITNILAKLGVNDDQP